MSSGHFPTPRLVQMMLGVIIGAPEPSLPLISQFKPPVSHCLAERGFFSSIEFLGKETPSSLLNLVDL